MNRKNIDMECLLWHSFWLSNKHCDFESVLKIIKLLNKIEQEKCDLEIILTSNLRLRKCLSHNFVSKTGLDIFLTFACDWECVLDIIKPYKTWLRYSFVLELWFRKCIRHYWVWKVWLWGNCDLELWQCILYIIEPKKCDLELIGTEKVFLWLRQSCDLEFWLRKCFRHKSVWKVRLWNDCDLELWLRMGLEYN